MQWCSVFWIRLWFSVTLWGGGRVADPSVSRQRATFNCDVQGIGSPPHPSGVLLLLVSGATSLPTPVGDRSPRAGPFQGPVRSASTPQWWWRQCRGGGLGSGFLAGSRWRLQVVLPPFLVSPAWGKGYGVIGPSVSHQRATSNCDVQGIASPGPFPGLWFPLCVKNSWCRPGGRSEALAGVCDPRPACNVSPHGPGISAGWVIGVGGSW